jgi:chromosomal replication initiation ATPase DnaA
MTQPGGRQLTLDWPHRVALGREDFLVTESNAKAVALVDAWPNWPSNAMFLAGPAGSGKTHLAEIWRQAADAAAFSASEVTERRVPQLLEKGALIIDDAPGKALDERALFHLLNLARERRASVLLVGREAPAQWSVALPDLRSRLLALPVITIDLPDDGLLRGVLLKLFADRQIAADEPLLDYLVRRMPRSFGAARDIVNELDRKSLEEGVKVSRALAGKVLDNHESPRLFADDGEG